MATRSTSALILDDELIVAMDLGIEFEERKWERVALAHTLEAAFGYANSENFDVAVLDINLPDGDSFELARFLDKSETGVIFMSAHPKTILPEDLHRLPFFRKPVMMEKLLETAANVVRDKAEGG